MESNSEFKKFVDSVKERFNGLDLTYCRATDWVEVSVTVPDAEPAETFVGNVIARQTRSPRRETVTVGDQLAQVLVSEWSAVYGTLVSNFRDVRKGDWLSFSVDSPLNILHIVDNQMKRLAAEEEGESSYRFQTDQVVVDMMGGEKVEVGRVSAAEYRLPGEILLMDEEGNVVVQNQFDRKLEYLLRSQSEDETSEYNANKKRRDKSNEDEGEDSRGGIGGLGGG